MFSLSVAVLGPGHSQSLRKASLLKVAVYAGRLAQDVLMSTFPQEVLFRAATSTFRIFTDDWVDAYFMKSRFNLHADKNGVT